jgi:hypothetical protein
MKRQLWLCICLFLFFVSLQGQNTEQKKIHTVKRTASAEKKPAITIIEQNDNFVFPGQQEEFYYIENDFSPPDTSWIASMEGFCFNTKKSNLVHLFFNFQEAANKLGANSFYVEEIYTVPDTIFIRISVFYLTEKEIDDNFELYPKNRIYIIGDCINLKEKNIKINGEKVKIQPLKYFVQSNSVGEETVVSIGGFTGSKYILEGKEEALPVYITLSGFEIAPMARMNGIGISFSTGGIHPLDMNLGQFLVAILQESE